MNLQNNIEKIKQFYSDLEKEEKLFESRTNNFNRIINLNNKRLSELNVNSLKRNKDGSISRQSSAGKEAVILIDQISKAKNNLEPFKNKFLQLKNSLIENIQKQLNQYFNHHFSNIDEIKERLLDGLNSQSFYTNENNDYKKLQIEHEKIFSNLNINEVINIYLKSYKFNDFTIKFGHKNLFLDLIFNKQYIKLKRIIHVFRYHYPYVFLIIFSGMKLGFIKEDDPVVTAVVSLIILIWVITFPLSFFYKKNIRKVHKMHSEKFLEFKNKLDDFFKNAAQDFIYEQIKKDIKLDLKYVRMKLELKN